LKLDAELLLDRCPHCRVDQPNLCAVSSFAVETFSGGVKNWACYACARCAGVVAAWSWEGGLGIQGYFPRKGVFVDQALPERAREYLKQAMESLSSPAGAVMLAAGSVDAMLKSKNLIEGSLYKRINIAVKKN